MWNLKWRHVYVQNHVPLSSFKLMYEVDIFTFLNIYWKNNIVLSHSFRRLILTDCLGNTVYFEREIYFYWFIGIISGFLLGPSSLSNIFVS